MKKFMLVLFIILFSCPVIAQEETLMGGKIESGGYGAFFTKIGQIDGVTGIFMGGQGGWIINHRFVLGAKGYGVINEPMVEGMQNIKLEFGCWGALLEYVFASNKLIHMNIHSMIGAGGVRYAVKDHNEDHDEVNYDDDGFFVLEPGLDIVLNVNKFFRVGIGATYRYVSGVDYANLADSDLGGISGHIVLKFGSF